MILMVLMMNLRMRTSLATIIREASIAVFLYVGVLLDSNLRAGMCLGMVRLSFHSFSDIKTDKRNQWLAKIHRDPGCYFEVAQNTKVCSLHFTVDDYVCGAASVRCKRRVFRNTAIPSVFPWPVEKFIRTSMTSKLAISPVQRWDMVESESVKELMESDHFAGDDGALEFETLQELKCKCKELEKEVEELQSRLAESERELRRALFCFENIKEDDEMVKFYSGVPDQATLMAFYEEILEDDAKSMRLWVGKLL